MTIEDRARALDLRRARQLPWHSPPHLDLEGSHQYLISASCFERPMKSRRHFLATLNYIHHNPVRHGYVRTWQDWPWSSAKEFLERTGREQALAIWKEYPLMDYGKKWDTSDPPSVDSAQ